MTGGLTHPDELKRNHCGGEGSN